MHFIVLKEKNNCRTVNILLLLLSHFLYLLFTFNSIAFVDGPQEYFLPQGARYPSYATELRH